MSWEAWGDDDDGTDTERLIEMGWLPPDDAEELREQLRAARSSSTGWVPRAERWLRWYADIVRFSPDDFTADDARKWALEELRAIIEMLPALPSDGETGGGRG